MWKSYVCINVGKDMKKNNNDKRRIPTYLLTNLLTLIGKELKLVLSKVRW